MRHIDEIIERKQQGIDCSEEESAEIKGFVKEHIPCIGTGDIQRLEEIAELFPIEFSEAQNEIENGTN